MKRALLFSWLVAASPSLADCPAPNTQVDGSTNWCVPPIGTGVQRINTTTNASGVWSVTFGTPFTSGSPIVNALPRNAAGATPMTCNVTSAPSNTVASGKCWQSTQSPFNLSLLGLGTVSLGVAPATVPVSTPVMIVAGEPTQ